MAWLIAGVVIALAGVAFGLRCWWELKEWARQCQQSRITVAYKQKVKIDAPLVEWLLWTRQAEKDKHSTGRVIYSMGGTSIAIIKRGKKMKKPNQPKQERSPVKEGRWAARDETVKNA